jgi:hypothetical protein
MSMHRKTPVAVMARQMRQYKPGEKVRILRGAFAGSIMTVRESSNDWLVLHEMAKRDVMSKQNVEPESGFTDEEMVQAKRAADKMLSKGD